MQPKRILWWGRHGNYGPNYPRNRTVIDCMSRLGWEVIEFQPRISQISDFEAKRKDFSDVSAVWVPCFRQRDVLAAARWAASRNVPLIFDPLISAYDKRVNERKKFPASSRQAKKLLKWERRIFSKADIIIADTLCHQSYFVDLLGCVEEKVCVLPVSAEEALFFPQPSDLPAVPELLFFGTFIELQGPAAIANSILFYEGPPAKLTFLGNGPERAACEAVVRKTLNPNISVNFEDWIPFEELPRRIRQADICLGIFGTGEKSFRVIPNKVYQAMACGKPVITMKGDAYPNMPENAAGGIYWCDAGDPKSIAAEMSRSVNDLLSEKGVPNLARSLYDRYFSNKIITEKLTQIFDRFP